MKADPNVGLEPWKLRDDIQAKEEGIAHEEIDELLRDDGGKLGAEHTKDIFEVQGAITNPGKKEPWKPRKRDASADGDGAGTGAKTGRGLGAGASVGAAATGIATGQVASNPSAAGGVAETSVPRGESARLGEDPKSASQRRSREGFWTTVEQLEGAGWDADDGKGPDEKRFWKAFLYVGTAFGVRKGRRVELAGQSARVRRAWLRRCMIVIQATESEVRKLAGTRVRVQPE